MTKKNFIALADKIRQHNRIEAQFDPKERGGMAEPFTACQIRSLAEFCEAENPRFNRERWLGYIAGTCGKNGGKV